MIAKSVLEYFYYWEKNTPNAVFLRQPSDDTWDEYTYCEVGQESRKLATALKQQNLKAGSHIGIISKNCYQWIVTDLAIMMAGMVSVPMYPNLLESELADVIMKGDVELVFIGKLDNWEIMKRGIPEHITAVRFPHYKGNAVIDTGVDWHDFVGDHPPMLDDYHPESDNLWTILFTSGTTGAPKGVMLTYGSAEKLMETEKRTSALGIFNLKEHVFFSYLPLNHIAERMIVEVACLVTGGSISFGESLERFPVNLQSVQPTVFMSVPRIWTKFQMAVLGKLPAGLIRRLMSIPGINILMSRVIKRKMGLSRAEIILTGAAPTPDSLKDWYSQFGIILQEVYAMTENAGGCCLMPRNNIKRGTVGKAFPDVDLAVDPANNEVIMKASWNCLGYYKDPELTKELYKEGWLRTGDSGFLDEEGYLHLTGRVVDTFKTSKGKFVAPAPLEWEFSRNHLIEQVCIAGLGAPQPLALVVLSDLTQKLSKVEIMKNLEQTLNDINFGLSAFQKISTVVILKSPWSVENAFLTPTLKIKRSVIQGTYGHLFESWHAALEPIIWAEV